MTQAQTQPRRVRPPAQWHLLEVKRVQPLTPHMIRVTLTGDNMAEFAGSGPAAHVKILLPLPGQDRPVLPALDADGRRMDVPGVERPPVRTYTPRHFDAAANELDIDFLVHDAGPASAWASRAGPGNFLAATPPKGAYKPELDAAWYVTAVDDSALPALGTLLEALPASMRVEVYAEVQDAHEEQALSTSPQTHVTWVHRDASGVVGRALEAAVRDATLPEGEGRIFVACEAMAMRTIRRHLLEERGLARNAVYTHGYWKQGEANHPDHDKGEEI